MKKIYLILIILALVLSIYLIYFKTDFFQNLGLKIPRNFEDCQNFGGTVTSDNEPGKFYGSTTYKCVYKKWEFETIRIF